MTIFLITIVIVFGFIIWIPIVSEVFPDIKKGGSLYKDRWALLILIVFIYILLGGLIVIFLLI